MPGTDAVRAARHGGHVPPGCLPLQLTKPRPKPPHRAHGLLAAVPSPLQPDGKFAGVRGADDGATAAAAGDFQNGAGRVFGTPAGHPIPRL